MPESKKTKTNYSLCKDSLIELKPSRSWEEIEKVRRNNRLLTFGLELSKRCNLRCIYCYANAGEKAENELTLEETLDAIKQAYELGARKIGNSFYKYYFDYFRYCQKIIRKKSKRCGKM